LLDIVRARRAELEGEPGAGISDDRRIWALIELSARAERGDKAARATLAAVERLFGAPPAATPRPEIDPLGTLFSAGARARRAGLARFLE
jgi:hypothetical protein